MVRNTVFRFDYANVLSLAKYAQVVSPPFPFISPTLRCPWRILKRIIGQLKEHDAIECRLKEDDFIWIKNFASLDMSLELVPEDNLSSLAHVHNFILDNLADKDKGMIWEPMQRTN